MAASFSYLYFNNKHQKLQATPHWRLYDLVSRGKDTSGSYQCYGGNNYQYPCIHSGAIINAGDIPTVWYNYTLTTAGTITGSINTTAATQSVCPKGWTLPAKTQIDSLSGGTSSSTYIPSFSPVLGGYYFSDSLSGEAASGIWWSSIAYNDIGTRYVLAYNASNLSTSTDGWRDGAFYIRCVSSS